MWHNKCHVTAIVRLSGSMFIIIINSIIFKRFLSSCAPVISIPSPRWKDSHECICLSFDIL